MKFGGLKLDMVVLTLDLFLFPLGCFKTLVGKHAYELYNVIKQRGQGELFNDGKEIWGGGVI